MQQFHPGTSEYKSAEEQLVGRQTNLQTQMQLKKQDFLRKESAIYNGVYQEIKQEVDSFCSANGIAIVLKFNGDPIDNEKPDDVLRAINSTVVYNAKQVDITPYIINSLAQRCGPAGGNSAGRWECGRRAYMLPLGDFIGRWPECRAGIARQAILEPIPFLVMDDWQGMEARRKQRTIAGHGGGRRDRLLERARCPRRVPPGRRRRQGIVFVRGDLPGCPRIPAVVANRIEMPRRTVLRAGGAAVEMVEHIMAALAGMQVDNCEVWVDQAEMPGCDGSGQAFVDGDPAGGHRRARRPRARLFVVRQVVRLGNEECWIEARPGRRRQDGHPIRTGLRQRQPHRPAVAGSDCFRPASSTSAWPPAGRSCCEREAAALQDQRAGAADDVQRPAGVRRRRPDRQRACGFPTSASATRFSTWSATSPWPAATWPDVSSPTAADIASTPSWCGRCWPTSQPRRNSWKRCA